MKPLELALLGLAFVGLLKRTPTSQTNEASPTGATDLVNATAATGRLKSTDTLKQKTSGAAAIVSSSGIIKADAVYLGKPRITAEAQVQNIKTREGENTPIKDTTNPLVKEYTVAGQTFRSSRSPSNKEEATAARKANIKDLADRGAYTEAQKKDLKAKGLL
jgi:hypothetical protein